MGAATSTRYELASALPRTDARMTKRLSHSSQRSRDLQQAQQQVPQQALQTSRVTAIDTPTFIDDEEQPMRSLPMSRGSLTIFAQPRVQRSLRDGVSTLPPRLFAVDSDDGDLVTSCLPDSVVPSTSFGSYPPRSLSITSQHAGTESLTVLSALRESNRRNSFTQTTSVSP